MQIFFNFEISSTKKHLYVTFNLCRAFWSYLGIWFWYFPWFLFPFFLCIQEFFLCIQSFFLERNYQVLICQPLHRQLEPQPDELTTKFIMTKPMENRKIMRIPHWKHNRISKIRNYHQTFIFSLEFLHFWTANFNHFCHFCFFNCWNLSADNSLFFRKCICVQSL